jgi:hypothetical protein
MNPILLRELSRWYPTQAAVWPDFVVVPAPLSNARSGLGQGLKPLLVQALVTKLPIKALDVAVLHGASWLNQDMPNAMRVAQSIKARLVNSEPLRHLILRPLDKLSETKSKLHTSLTACANCSGTRSFNGRLAFLRRRTTKWLSPTTRHARRSDR